MAPSKAFVILRCGCFFFLLFSSTTTADNSTFVPTDVILINCGASGKTTDDESREWQGDVPSKFLVGKPDSSSVATVPSHVLVNLSSVPFLTARIFTRPATYSIPVARERNFVRLYFYPSAYGGRNASAAVFDVEAAGCTLLRSFSPAWDADTLGTEYVFREYSLNVSGSGFVNLTFTPSTRNPGSYAFINGIEVVSMPEVFTFPKTLSVVGLGATFELTPTAALETMYRLNVGGASVSRADDSGLFREWADDSFYIFGTAFGLTRTIDPSITLRYPPSTPRYIAPDQVYTTQRSMTGDVFINRQSNLTWLFTVDPGFNYLLRLHFCDIQSIYSKPNERVFSIFINNMTATDQADVYLWATHESGVQRQQQGSGLGVPFYKDYITNLPNGPEQVDIQLDLHPNEFTKPELVDAVLNGLEVFKINNIAPFNNVTDNSLAGIRPSPQHSFRVDPNPKVPNKVLGGNKGSVRMVASIVGGSIGGLIVAWGVTLRLLHRRRKQRAMAQLDAHLKTSPSSTELMRNPLPSKASRRFPFVAIEDATSGFDDNLVIGVGGFGRVYKGVIRTHKSTAAEAVEIKVAIKRATKTSEQGVREFLNEIQMLSKLRHRHLVSLIGFCDDLGEMILVYDYMANGSLREHLYSNCNKPTLRWQQRLEICIGAARGLHYLHTGVQHTIIHRDVKTTNILLDESWIAKVADFGLSKAGPDLERRNIHISTVVKGSFGYLDPEYYRLQRLTDKSDVYSFGVVLLEVLCGRPAVDAELPLEQANLAEWARCCYADGMMESIVDPHLKGQIQPDCFVKFVEIAIMCISDRGLDRPSMGDVLWGLEYAMQLQEDPDKELNASTAVASCLKATNLTSTDSVGLIASIDVFSSIIDPSGR